MIAVTLIVAVADNGVIGRHGAIPWRIPEDLARFKRLTMGKPILMGRKTWDSLPRKPLPGRTNVVVTNDTRWTADGAVQARSPAEAVQIAAKESSEVMAIGGAEIYRALLPRATRIELTEVHRAFDGDAHFSFDRTGWRETAREDHATADGLGYSFVTLVRD